MATDLVFNQAALRALGTGPELKRFIGDLGEEVAARANAKAATLFESHGGGGVGSIQASVTVDERGVHSKIGYPPEHFYMWFGEIGTEHQRARPHLRPALYGTRRATGGSESSIRGIRQDKATQAKTRASRKR